MVSLLLVRNLSLTTALLLSLLTAAPAQNGVQAEFERAYFLQIHDRNLEGAIAAYQRVADDATAPDKLRAEARKRLAQCREDLASADFARLMPPDVIAYGEISNPGRHIAWLCKQLGLVREEGAPAAKGGGAETSREVDSAPKTAGEGTGGTNNGRTSTGRTSKGDVTPLGNGIFFPHDFTLSPALIESMQAFRGVAGAVTGIDARGEPEGLLVLHPGDAGMLRGFIESAVQFAEPAEPIEGYKTYRIQKHAWVTVTARMILASRSREQVAAAVARLRDPQAPSLASNEDLKRLKADRADALLFAYVNGPKAAEQFRRHARGQEAWIASGVLDLDHLRSVSVSIGATPEGLQLQARVDLMEGHHNLIYGLIRTAPCGRESLEHVPGGAAAVALLGLNPPDAVTPIQATATRPAEYVTAMDIGREFFANLREAALFVSPVSKPQPSGPPIPDIGLVLIAKDPARSQALWSQLLSLPSMFLPAAAGGVSEVDLEGSRATEYRFPNAPPVLLARVQDHAIVIGTRGAVTAAVKAGPGRGAITEDAGFKPLLARLTPNTSKAILIHAGRSAETAASLAKRQEAKGLSLAAAILSNLRVCLVTDEKPTQFTVRVEATGLPNVPDAVRKLTAARQMHQKQVEAARKEP